MNRFEKKCLLGSTLTHGLLGVVLVVGLAFKRSEKTDVESVPPMVTMFPVTVIDGPSRGGNPNVTLPPAVQKPVQAAAQPPPAPAPAPAEVEPPRPQPRVVESAPAPRREEPKPIAKADFQEPTKKTPPKKFEFTQPGKTSKADNSKDKFTFSQSRPSNTKATAKNSNPSSNRQNDLLNAFAKTLDKAGKNIRENTSGGTTIEMPGVGGGGAAAVNYAQFVKAIYDEAWIDPQDVADENATVKTEIIIRRDGTVVSAKILGRSGVRGLDNSVQGALDRVRNICPFPEGSTDSQRTFILKFNLKSKRSIG